MAGDSFHRSALSCDPDSKMDWHCLYKGCGLADRADAKKIQAA